MSVHVDNALARVLLLRVGNGFSQLPISFSI